jgi:hypothetical protein
MAVKFTTWLKNRPDGHKIYQHFLFQCPQKYIQIGIFGLKANIKSGNPARERQPMLVQPIS